MTKFSYLLLLCITLVACQSNTTANQAPTTTPLVGADRDAHGCIGSAGYAWCEKMQRCVRPWELKTPDTSSSEEAFKKLCLP